MAEITWIKLRTNMFDDEKIKLLERLPDGDMILVIWMKLLAQAGKVNCGGYIMIAENIPMTVNEMVVIFNRPMEKITFALEALKRYGMIEIDENSTVFITNWEKHQNIEGMEKIRLQNKERQKRHRERKKIGCNQPQLTIEESTEERNVTGNVTVTLSNATDIEKEKEKEKENNKVVDSVIEKLKTTENVPGFVKITDKRKKAINARIEEYGIDSVKTVLENIEASDFFRDSKRDKVNWYTLDWIFNPNNFVKILEGKYNKKPTNNYNTNAIPTGMQHNVVNVDNLFGGTD